MKEGRKNLREMKFFFLSVSLVINFSIASNTLELWFSNFTEYRFYIIILFMYIELKSLFKLFLALLLRMPLVIFISLNAGRG